MPAFARWDVGTLERGHVGRLEGWKVEIDHGRWTMLLQMIFPVADSQGC
ncbi:MAG: hypothetical protein P8Y14_13820 [Anaerolineales bacterium]